MVVSGVAFLGTTPVPTLVLLIPNCENGRWVPQQLPGVYAWCHIIVQSLFMLVVVCADIRLVVVAHDRSTSGGKEMMISCQRVSTERFLKQA